MKRITIGMLLSAGSLFQASAGDIGLGVSLKANEGSIYVPYQIGAGMLVEGNLRYTRQDSSGAGPDHISESFSSSSQSEGVGLFHLRQLGDKNRLYLGSRLFYVRDRASRDMQYGDRLTSTRSGWGITPTLGYEYFPVRHLSVGGEVGWSHTWFRGSDPAFSPDGIGTFRSRGTATGTTSSIIVRAYF